VIVNQSDTNLRAAFSGIFGGNQPFDFQIEVARHLLNGRSVILQAPTGSGKTWTALFPFLHAWRAEIPFPRKCLYAVPLRVLATQFKENAESLVAGWNGKAPAIRLQTGEQQDDPTFEQDLIFTTIDQVLSSALSVPYSLGYRRANLNAGAVFSSYLVCDELHLFPVDERTGQGALATLIELLRTFRCAMPFLLMTATLSAQLLANLQEELDAELVTIGKDALPKIESQQKTRRYHVVEAELNARAVLDYHETRSLVICNQVQRAIDTYEELCQAVATDPRRAGTTEVMLLHSRFITQHRAGKEQTIRHQFGDPKQIKSALERTPSMIVVATQTIEVGLDITCERLHTELAPANALIQRAGRCARYKDEEGDVLIYRLPEDSAQPHLPYDATLCTITWEAFRDEQFNGRALQFSDEQQIVTAVHNPTDEKLFARIKQEGYRRWQSMSAAMLRGDKEGRATLIRKVDSRTILVHGDPKQIRNPYRWRGFSLFHGTLRGWLNRLKAGDGPPADWWLRYPVEAPDESEESRRQPTYSWDNYVQDPAQLDVSPIFVVNPELVAYDQWRGFRLLPAETAIAVSELCQEPPIGTVAPRFLTRYNLESYARHIQNMLSVYYHASNLAQQMAFAGKRLAANSNLSPEQFERAVLLVLALHDVGKLQQGWQDWSHAYQRMIGDPAKSTTMIVHTNYKPHKYPEHEQAERAISIPRPHHAAEGACAVWPIILRTLDNDDWLSRAVFTAIARHHAPFVDDVEPYSLHQHSQTAIAEALSLIGVSTQLATLTQMKGRKFPKGTALQNQLIASDDPDQWLIYTLLVRALRLCDGHAVEGVE
jgi:CRISPR-associated endonuclease/helicase Cas3